jgi:hypothetical protein
LSIQVVQGANGIEERLDFGQAELIGRRAERIGWRIFAKQYLADCLSAVGEGIEVVAAFEGHD